MYSMFRLYIVVFRVHGVKENHHIDSTSDLWL
jgi:hypothetical protein